MHSELVSEARLREAGTVEFSQYAGRLVQPREVGTIEFYQNGSGCRLGYFRAPRLVGSREAGTFGFSQCTSPPIQPSEAGTVGFSEYAGPPVQSREVGTIEFSQNGSGCSLGCFWAPWARLRCGNSLGNRRILQKCLWLRLDIANPSDTTQELQ